MTLQTGSRPVPNCPDYILIRRLGAGAFGEVWHAHGPGGLSVALKFIRLDAQILALELRSLEAMKSIRHPNLVSLFGAWCKDNCLILAMELCDRSLQDRLAEALGQKLSGIPQTELLSYISDAANGLDALNAKQVQHRDVKPANLLLLNSGVKVADFGLAKALEQTVASNSGAGTVAYTAPECFRGELTQRSDQYSLAVTYYHLRTGRLLFQGNQAQVMYGHLQLEPDLTAFPLAERAVLERALAKEPGKRWPNCKTFVGDLTTAHHRAKREEHQRKESQHNRQEQQRQKETVAPEQMFDERRNARPAKFSWPKASAIKERLDRLFGEKGLPAKFSWVKVSATSFAMPLTLMFWARKDFTTEERLLVVCFGGLSLLLWTRFWWRDVEHRWCQQQPGRTLSYLKNAREEMARTKSEIGRR